MPDASPVSLRLRLLAWLRYGVSLSMLGWVAAQIDWRGLGGLAAIDWSFAFPAVLLAGFAYPLQAWRWQRLLAVQGVPLAPARVHSLFWIGNFYNSFLPGGIAGDGVRLLATWREHPQRKAAAAASIASDRLLGLGALLSLAVLAIGGQLATAGSHRELETIFLASVGALGLLAGSAALVTHTHVWDGFATRRLGTERARNLRDAADALAHNQGAIVVAAALSVAVWLLDFGALWLLARAVGFHVDPLSLTVAATAAYVAASLPISIGGHGVREGTLVLVLGWLGFGVDQPEGAQLLALAFWTMSTFWSAAGGCALFLNQAERGSKPSGPMSRDASRPVR